MILQNFGASLHASAIRTCKHGSEHDASIRTYGSNILWSEHDFSAYEGYVSDLLRSEHHQIPKPRLSILLHFYSTVLQPAATTLQGAADPVHACVFLKPHICTKLAHKICIKKSMKTAYPNSSNF